MISLLSPTASEANLFQADPEGRFPGDDSDVNGEGPHFFSQDLLHIVTWELKHTLSEHFSHPHSLTVHDSFNTFFKIC